MIKQSQQRRLEDLRERHSNITEFNDNMNRLVASASAVVAELQKSENFAGFVNISGVAGSAASACEIALEVIDNASAMLGKPWGDRSTMATIRSLRDNLHRFGSFAIDARRILKIISGTLHRPDDRELLEELRKFAKKADRAFRPCFDDASVLHAKLTAEQIRIESELDSIQSQMTV
ncbi:hypothetical protein MGN01_41160 [Methylobacterium gnaphalii]|uniref:Uncharacterized protein n=2 Tax=Methylobacterium gnaphalii TaxID=1010610 RepID=A0A512JQQ9_9HYPH|nr:hypothetical protein MGN01_41160 [Methylobacterium gnaphalii]GLS49378.1 hypothetical protein GCM10007885_22260 [Methylobacterium gnaphalii]